MGLSFQYWYLLPISVLIATIAMSSGIGGAVFFLTAFYLSAEIGAIDCYLQLWQRSFSVSVPAAILGVI